MSERDEKQGGTGPANENEGEGSRSGAEKYDRELEVDDLVSHRIDLAGLNDGIASTAAPEGDWLKAIVYPYGVHGGSA